MKNRQTWLTFFLCLFLLPLWSNESPKKLSHEYASICGDCVLYYETIFDENAYDNLAKLKTDILPIIAAAEQLEDYSVLVVLYPRLRYIYGREEDLGNSIKLSLAYLKLPPKYLSEEKIIREYGYLSEIYSQLGIRDEAYKYHLKALEGARNIDNLNLKFRILFQSGTVFFFLKKYDKAISFYQQSLEIARNSLSHKNYEPYVISGLVSTCLEMKNYELAKEYLEQQLLQPVNPSIIAHTHQQFGDLFMQQAVLDSAQYYYQKALSFFQNSSSGHNKNETLLSLAELAIEQKELPDAIQYFYAILEGESSTNKEHQAQAYNGLARVFELQGDFTKAFQYQKTFSMIQPLLFQDSSSLKLDKLRMEFLMEQKEEEILQTDREKLLIARSAILLLFVLVGVIWLLKMKREAHRLAVQQKQQIEQQNEQLTDYNQRLKRFNSVVSHDLKQPLRTTISILGLYRKKYADSLTKEAKDYLDISNHSLKQMYRLIEGLLNITQLEKVDEEDKSHLNASTPLIDAQAQLQTLIQEKNAEITIHPNVGQWPLIYAFELPMMQLWQNLLANAVKFTPDNRIPKIEISVVEEKHQYVFSIKDNGIGIEKEYRSKIFEMFNQLNDRSSFEGNGIGLATCKRIIDMHAGKIWVTGNADDPYSDDQERKGSTFYFALSKKNKTPAAKEKRYLKEA